MYGGDLEATGLVASLAYPGGNVTGIGSATAETAAKNLELIAEMLPTAQRVAVLINANSVFGAAMLEHVKTAAELRKIEIRSISVGDSDRLDADLASFEAWKPDALLIHPALPQALIASLTLNSAYRLSRQIFCSSQLADLHPIRPTSARNRVTALPLSTIF